jgi:tetratricopeptide (TPR) repeat protein
LATILAVGHWAYSPGLSGAFHFDDYPNLSALGDYGSVHSLETFLAYLRSGIAGPTGRPLSLLSFLLDADSWPADAGPFLRTNVFIHLLNGAVLTAVFLLLLRNVRDPRLQRDAGLIAVVASAVWLLHPYLVSTTLYVVQRMTQLSALFSLVGLLLYLKGREVAYRTGGDDLRSLAWCSAGVGLGTGFATLSKENGVLLPLLVLVIEFFALRPLWGPAPRSRAYSVWLAVFLVVPALAVLIYLGAPLLRGGIDEAPNGREFSLLERLMTQPRVLFEYLSNLLIPRDVYPGLFREQYPIARSLTDPPSTALFALAVVLSAVLALLLRRRAPLIATALLFFLAAHLVESSTIMLEVYFDHRNYLPAAFLFLPAAAWLMTRTGWRVLAIPSLACLAILTYQHARLWGEPTDLYTYWSQRNPESVRAQVAVAGQLARSGRLREAHDGIAAALARQPLSPALRLLNLSIARALGRLTEDDVDRAVQAIGSGPFDQQVPRMVEPFVDQVIEDAPAAVPAPVLERVFDAFLANERYLSRPGMAATLHFERGRLLLREGRGPGACAAFHHALERAQHVETGLRVAALLATYGYFEDAEGVLELSRAYLRFAGSSSLRFPKPWYEREIDRLSQTFAEDLAATASPRAPVCSGVTPS